MTRINYTDRGFGRIDFKDADDHECSLQESSSASQPKIWLGLDAVEVIDYEGTPKVIDLKPLGGNVQALGRMHLTQGQVQDLLPILLCFAMTGELSVAHVHKEEDVTKHPEFAEWYVWYGHHYTTHIPITDKGQLGNLDQALSFKTWCAARPQEGRRDPIDLHREWKFSKGCDCGCNTPSFTEPMEALRFLMGRMNDAGVSQAVGESYAWDIMQILKRLRFDVDGEIAYWTSMGDKRPANATQIVFIDGNSEIGLGYYMDEDAAEWPDTVRYLTYLELTKIPTRRSVNKEGA